MRTAVVRRLMRWAALGIAAAWGCGGGEPLPTTTAPIGTAAADSSVSSSAATAGGAGGQPSGSASDSSSGGGEGGAPGSSSSSAEAAVASSSATSAATASSSTSGAGGAPSECTSSPDGTSCASDCACAPCTLDPGAPQCSHGLCRAGSCVPYIPVVCIVNGTTYSGCGGPASKAFIAWDTGHCAGFVHEPEYCAPGTPCSVIYDGVYKGEGICVAPKP